MAKAQEKPIAIVAGTIIDGSGKVLHNQAIVVQGSKIVSVGGQIPAGAPVYNLGTLTVTPGLIDTHAHIMWHFDNGRLAGKENSRCRRSFTRLTTPSLRSMRALPRFKVPAHPRISIFVMRSLEALFPVQEF